MNFLTKYTLLISTLSLAACVAVSTPPTFPEQQLVVTSARDIAKVYPVGSRFSVSSRQLEQNSFPQALITSVYAKYQQEIINKLTQQGYQFYLHGNAAPADFEVIFGVAASKDLSDETIIEKFGVSPGLTTQGNSDKGSFLVYIQDAQSKQRVWRGAVQGVIIEELSDQERKNRIQHVVNIALSSF